MSSIKHKPPKTWTSARVCPACASRATKIYNLNEGKYRCQVCEHKYDPPTKSPRLRSRVYIPWD